MWLFAAYLSYTSFDTGRRELEQTLLAAAKTQMGAIEREIAGKESALTALATSPSLDRRDFAAFRVQAEQVARQAGAVNIVLLGMNGEQVVNSLRPIGQPLPTEPPPFFAKVMESHRLVVSDLFIGPVTHQPLVSLAIPVMRDGRVIHVLCLSLDATHLAPFVHGDTPSISWVGALMDSTDTIVARRREPEKYVGQKGAAEVLTAIHAQPSGVFESTSLEGTKILAAFSRSPLCGWTLVVAVPRAVLEAKPRRALLLSLAGGTGLFLFTALSAWLLWRSFVSSERARERSRLLLQHASDGVHILDTTGMIIEASDSFCHMLGYGHDEVIGMDVGQWEARMIPDEWGAIIARQLQGGEAITFETRHRRKNGSVFDAEVSCQRLKLDNHQVLYCASRDITERKRAEATLKSANRELEQFAYIASHDLREPLRMISSYIALLGRRYGEVLNEEARDFLGFATEGAKRMDRMVLDLLEFSRVGRMSDPFAPVPLEEIVATAIANLKVAIDENAAEITVAADLPTVTGSHGELVRLLQNLIGNALKYRDPNRSPVVTISARRDERAWVVAVDDNGIGIAPDYFERIFDIFQRLHTRDKYEGTGIGLAVCRRIVEYHGGRIWVESNPGIGSTFLFTLPDGGATPDHGA